MTDSAPAALRYGNPIVDAYHREANLRGPQRDLYRWR
jgi:hypothetical protein